MYNDTMIENMMDYISIEGAKQMQPLVLAMVGDSVQTLFVRSYVAKNIGVKPNIMNKLVSSVVSAGAQYQSYILFEQEFSEEELGIAKRARNAHFHQKAKNFSVNEYIHATALEAVFGFLYLTGQTERLEYFLNKTTEKLNN